MVLVRNRGFDFHFPQSPQVPGPASVSPFNLTDIRPPEEFWASLCSMSSEDVMAANQTPQDFFCPWICGIGACIATHLFEAGESLGPFARLKDFKEEGLQKIIYDIESNHLMLCQNISNLTSYTRSHPHFETPAMTLALNELQVLRSKTEALQTRGQTLMNRLIGTLALEESRRSIQQSISTKRLSQLAYIFLPLNLSTSIFGMNVIELQNTQLRMFYGTAGIALISSLILWLCLGWFSRPEFTNNVIGIWKAIFILFKFTSQAPAHAVILNSYALCHSIASTRLLLMHLGLWDIIWYEKPPANLSFFELSLEVIIHRTNRWSRFWYARVSRVEDFIKTSEWKKNYLLQKKGDQVDKDV